MSSENDKKKNKSYLSAVIVGLILFAIFLIYICAMGSMFGSYKSLPFTKESWAKADAENRGCMYTDLEKNYKLEGMTLKEIEDLLGPPDSTYRFGNNNKKLSYTYDLGYMGQKGGMFNFRYSMHLYDNDNNGIIDSVIASD